MNKILFIIVTLLTAYTAKGVEPAKTTIIINIENMRSDLIGRYRGDLSKDGFMRFLDSGTNCNNAKLKLPITSTVATFATIATGSWPQSHGITSNSYYSRKEKRSKGIIEDSNYQTIGGRSTEGNISTKDLLSMTLSDQLKLISNGRSKVYSIGLNNYSTALSAGHKADGVYWLEGSSCNMISSTFFIDKFPKWVSTFNSESKNSYETKWKLLNQEGTYDESDIDNSKYEIGFFDKYNVFPYSYKVLKSRSKDYSIYKSLPIGNEMITNFSKELLNNEPIGKDQYPDIINITYTLLGSNPHFFGAQSVEMQDMFLRLDQEIAKLLNHLDSKLGKDNYIVAMVGHTPAPYSVEYLNNEYNFTADHFYPQKAVALLTSYLNIKFKQAEWIKSYTDQQIYLDHNLIEDNEIELSEIQDVATQFIRQFDGISKAYSYHHLINSASSTKNSDSFQKGFNRTKSGDIIFTLKPGWQMKESYNPYYYCYEYNIPMAIMGANITQQNISKEVQGIDLVPTICKMLDIQPPFNSEGTSFL